MNEVRPSGDAPEDELRQLTAQLGHLGELLAQSREQLGAYLVRRESEAAARPTEPDSTEALRGQIAELGEKIDRLAGRLAPFDQPEPTAAPVGGSAEWEQAILGPTLAANPALAFHRQQLIGGVLEGNAEACAFSGQLLVFQSASAERLPQLLKEIGEAFYRWQPRTTPGPNPLEESLVAWLKQHCETAGISNTIALVYPGERFDATRHTATSRGVEIWQVHGWVVLRDNGKVYTKATVSAR